MVFDDKIFKLFGYKLSEFYLCFVTNQIYYSFKDLYRKTHYSDNLCKETELDNAIFECITWNYHPKFIKLEKRQISISSFNAELGNSIF